jgi:cob(I)alamin adenosyltransferase
VVPAEEDKVKTFNKRGDEGETSLLFGGRVAKNSLRCEAYGTLDEAVSCLGIARNVVKKDRTKEVILKVQKEIFDINAELATEPENYERFASRFTTINDGMVDELEKIIDEIESQVVLPKSFIIPGGNLASAQLDLARSIVRRAERRVADLRQNNETGNTSISHYMNRLADLLFMLARYEEA